MGKERLLKLQNKVAESDCDVYLVEDPINLFYLTGIQMSAGVYAITPKESKLYVDGRYYELCKDVPGYPIEEFSLKPYKRIGFNEEKTSYARYKKFEGETKPLPDLTAELREIKDDKELSLLRKAAALGSRGFDYATTLLNEGITEIEIAAELDIFWKREGAKGVAFDPIVAFGSNSSMPHYHSQKNLLKQGQPVLLDIGVTLEHYHSDMTRVLFFGEVDSEIRTIYRIVREAHEAALKICKAGTKIGDLDEAARGLIKEAGYSDRFTHGLGHGIGLEVHEAPVLRNKEPYKEKTLKAGMVITIEPGIYIPEKGGVRLEDTVIVTEQGYENLTKRPFLTGI